MPDAMTCWQPIDRGYPEPCHGWRVKRSGIGGTGSQLELDDCFASAPTDDSDEVIQALATLVQMNREITRLVAQAR